MNGDSITSEQHLIRLLQVGVVLEEIVEARSYQHYQSLARDHDSIDDALEELFEEARDESATHRAHLETLINQLDANTIPFTAVEARVDAHYGQTKPEDFEALLYDQLHGEASAYTFYDDLIAVIERSDAEFSIDRHRLLTTLRKIRDEEADGAKDVTKLLEPRE